MDRHTLIGRLIADEQAVYVIRTNENQIAGHKAEGDIINKIVYITAFKQQKLVCVVVHMQGTILLLAGAVMGNQQLVDGLCGDFKHWKLSFLTICAA